jgi:hypothetical protein
MLFSFALIALAVVLAFVFVWTGVRAALGHYTQV